MWHKKNWKFTFADWQCHDQQNEFDLFNSRCISKIFILQVGKVKATMCKTFASQSLNDGKDMQRSKPNLLLCHKITDTE